jgi:hypothetical protein
MTRDDAWEALCALVPTESRGRCVAGGQEPLPVVEWTDREREQICAILIDLIHRVRLAEARCSA